MVIIFFVLGNQYFVSRVDCGNVNDNPEEYQRVYDCCDQEGPWNNWSATWAVTSAEIVEEQDNWHEHYWNKYSINNAIDPIEVFIYKDINGLKDFEKEVQNNENTK